MMTNFEAVNAVVGIQLPDANVSIKALLDLGLVDTAQYSITNVALIDRAAIAVLIALKQIAKIDEGGFGLTFNTSQADKTISFLYTKSGSIGPNPTTTTVDFNITDGSKIW